VDHSATKQGSVPLTGRKLQGLRRLSPDVISKAIDETNTQIIRIGLTFLGTAAFCLLSLLSPDSALLGGSEKIIVPLAGPVSFFGFMLLGPAVLIMLRIYLQIYVEHSNRLERLGRSMRAIRAPTLVPLKNPLIRVFSGLTFYLVLPTAMILFAWKAAVFLAWGAGLSAIAVAVIACHLMLRSSRFSWRKKGLLSVSAAIIAGGVMLGLGPPRRPFDLFRADLSGHWLSGYDLPNANLQYTNLRGAYLVRTNLRGAIMANADLTGADLMVADLTGVYLGQANLTDAMLAGANLLHADLITAKLTGANLLDANLTAAHLTGADLTGADLTGADLADADLSYADLSGANMRAPTAYFSDAKNLTQTQLDKGCGNEQTKLPTGLTLKPCK
jgi:uncharacterized protein YjbI with pentapeptide repeats